MPKNIIFLAIFWTLSGLWNLWISFNGISSDLGAWDLISKPTIHSWFKMAIPFELGLGTILLVVAIFELSAVALALLRKPFSIKLALGTMVSIAILNLITGTFYAFAPSEIQTADLTSAAMRGFMAGIVQMVMFVLFRSIFLKDLNKPEMKNYFGIIQPHEVLQQKIEIKSEENVSNVKSEYYCRFCGSRNKVDAAYCEKCGKQIN